MDKKTRRELRAKADIELGLISRAFGEVLKVVREDPSAETLFEGITQNLDAAILFMNEGTRVDVAKALVHTFIAKVLVVGISKNPMWGSPALALQIEAAMASVMSLMVAKANEEFGARK